jgi:hypothetical protein
MPVIKTTKTGAVGSSDPLFTTSTRPVADLFNNITDYDFVKNKWRTGEVDRASVCSSIIGRITATGQDPSAYAKILYRRGDKAQAKLIFRCIARERWGDQCTDDDITAAFEVMGLSDNKRAMNENLDGILFGTGAASSGATYGGGALHQAGGAPHDLATLLFLKRNLIDKLVEVGPRYAGQLIEWIDGQLRLLAKLKGCVQDILGINPDTFYDDITGAMGRLYNQGAGLADEAKSRVEAWLSTNKAMAFGLTALIVRYQNNIMDTGHSIITSLPAIFSAVANHVGPAASVINQFWLSDPGLALLLSLYYYDQHPDEVNDAVVRGFAEIKSAATGAADMYMAALARFEAFSNGQIDDFAQVKINDDLIKMMAKLETSIDRTDTAPAHHLTELARILNETAKIQFKIVNTVEATARTRSQTARIAAARATLIAVQDQLTEETQALIVAKIEAKGPGKGAFGGKSHSRKLHKKVSKSKRPKRSVHSRKAKGVKRSNKKH